MEVSLTKKLNDQEARELREYLRGALQNAEYVYGNFPLTLAVYVDGVPYVTYSGRDVWQLSSPYLYVGKYYLGDFPKEQALAMLFCFCQLLSEDAEITRLAGEALSKYLVDTFNQLRKGLVTAETVAQGIAFTKDNQVAALLDGEWYLNNGEQVDVSGEQWTRCTL